MHFDVRDLCAVKAEWSGHQSDARFYLGGTGPIYFRLAAGSSTGTCGEVLMTRVLPSE
ncbi:MAG: hypothetical protein ACREEK_00165 [Bradyrhizobium sp.]